MEQKNTADLYVMHLYGQFKKSITKGIVLFFKAINFILGKWWLILLLVVGGVVLGYFSSGDTKQSQKATALLRINFDSVNYVYEEIDLINEKIKEGDSVFFSNLGLNSNSLEVAELTLTAMVNLKDLGEEYDKVYRNVDGLIRNVEFDKSQIEIAKTFNAGYRYHSLDLMLSPTATRKTIDRIVDYLNSNKLLNEVRDTAIVDMKKRIISNEEIVRQIDEMIETYSKNQSVNAATGPMFVVDKDFNLHALLNIKTSRIIRNDEIRKRLILAKDIVVVTNRASLVKIKPGLLGKKTIFYPIFFVFAFLFMAWIRYVFFYLKKIAEDNE